VFAPVSNAPSRPGGSYGRLECCGDGGVRRRGNGGPGCSIRGSGTRNVAEDTVARWHASSSCAVREATYPMPRRRWGGHVEDEPDRVHDVVLTDRCESLGVADSGVAST